MALLAPNSSEDVMLQNILNKTAPQNVVLRLYTNNYTPVETSTEANFTEASGFGYTSVTLAGASWTITPGNPTSASFAQQTFTFTGTLGNVYGYYMTQLTSGFIMWAERFTDGPYNIVNSGDQIKITPVITLE